MITNPPTPARSIPTRWKVTWTVLAVGFFGLGLCRLAAEFLGGEKAFIHTTAGAILTFTFAGVWIFGLLVLVPICVFKDRRQQSDEELTTYPWWQWLLLLPFIFGDVNARVPRWITVPLLIVGFYLAALLIIVPLSLYLHELFRG